MVDPFAMATATLFNAPGSSAGVYDPAGAALPVRVIRTTKPDEVLVAGRQLDLASTMMQLQCSDFAGRSVAAPMRGALVAIGSTTWEITSNPNLDVEGYSWSCEAEAA